MKSGPGGGNGSTSIIELFLESPLEKILPTMGLTRERKV